MHPHHRPIVYLLRALFLLLCAVFALIVPGAVQAQDVRSSVRVLEHPATVMRTSWSPDGTQLMTVSNSVIDCTQDCTYAVYLWDTENGGDPVILPHNEFVFTAVWSPTGDRILTHTLHSHLVRIWSLDGSVSRDVQQNSMVEGVRWSPDGTRLLTWGFGLALMVWPLEDMEHRIELHPLRNTDTDWRFPIIRTEWSADGQYVFALVASYDGPEESVIVWAADGSGVIAELKHDLWIRTMITSADSNHILTCSGDGTARLWTLDGNAAPLIFEHDAKVRNAAWDGSANQIVTMDEFGQVWSWTWDGEGVTRIQLNHPGGARSASPSSVREGVFATWQGGGLGYDQRYQVRVWGMTPLHFEEPIVLYHPAAVEGIAWSPTSMTLLTWAADDIGRVYHRLDGEYVDFIALPHTDRVRGAVWNPDGAQIATWSRSQVFIWSPFED